MKSPVSEFFEMKKAALIAFEGSYRVCFCSAILMLVLIIQPIIGKVPAEYYYSVPILSSLVLFFITLPLGNSFLGSDLRGIVGLGFALELIAIVTQSFDSLVMIYRVIQGPYLYIDYGLISMCFGRCIWLVRTPEGLPLGFPKFDVIRRLVGGAESHSYLTRSQIMGGYILMITAFLMGCVFHHYKIWFAFPASVSLIIVIVLNQIRKTQSDFMDLYDIAIQNSLNKN